MQHPSTVITVVVTLFLLLVTALFPNLAAVTVPTAPVTPTVTVKIAWDQGRVEEAANRAQSVAKFLEAVKLVQFDPGDPGDKLVIDGSGSVLGKIKGPVPTKRAAYGETLLADCVQNTLRPLSAGGVFFVFNVNNAVVKNALKGLYWLELDSLQAIKLGCP